jgi:sulfate permease, SulP family
VTLPEKVLPAYGWLRNYRREDLPKDLTAAVVIAAMLVPQGMAYALLAGLPASYGLYASTVPAVVYALFGTSRHMPVGPPALMALLTFTSVSALAEPRSPEYISLALLLALMVGVLQLMIGFLRMGFITNFISHPVLSGFIYASVVVIALSQVEHILGVSVSGQHSTVGVVLEYARNIGEAKPLTLAIGLGSLAALVVLGKALPRLPGSLLVVAAATLIVYFFGLDERGVEIVGEVPQGLPGFSLPALDAEAARTLLSSAAVVAFVGFIESISVAKAIAAREKYKIDSNQELKALGLANTSAAFFSGFPVAGSFSRTAVQYESGGRTQLASIATALLIVLVLLFLTPLFYYLPNAALAAVILVAVYKLLDFKEVQRVFRIRRIDGYSLVTTFALTLLWGVEQGVIVGAAFALLAFLRRTAYPHIAELGYVAEKDAFLGLESFPEAKTYPEALILRFDARLYFANVPFLEEQLIKEAADRPNLTWIFIDCRGVNSIDVTAIEGLEDLMFGYKSRGLTVIFTHMKLPVRDRLEKAGWDEKFENYHYQTTREAFRAVGLSVGDEVPDPEQRMWRRPISE